MSNEEIIIVIVCVFIAWGLFCYIMGLRFAAKVYQLELYKTRSTIKSLWRKLWEAEGAKNPW